MAAEVYKFGEFCLDVIVRRLSRNEETVSLPSITFDILKLLVERKGRLVEKEEIRRRVWPNQFIEENNLTVRISAIRKMLGENADRKFIETVPGRGYRFVARVLEGGPEYRDRPFRSLAVLPFTVAEGQQRLNYISEGVVGGLINRLSQLPNLKVMARSTVFRYKGKEKDPQEVGEELAVDVVLTGRMDLYGSNLILSAELINTGDGSHVWGAKYIRNFSNLLELQDEIVEELSEGLRIKLTANEKSRLAGRPTDNSEAYHLYLKGQYFYNNKRNVKGIQKALSCFKRAVKHDPNFALAYSGLTDCYLTFSSYGLVPPKRVMPKAQASILKALEIDELLGDAHTSLAKIKADFEWDWEGAQKECERALELGPFNAHTYHVFANYLAKVGRGGDAIVELKKARELDTLSLNINVGLCKMFYFARRCDEAIEQCRETLEIDPCFAPANGILGLTYLLQQQYEKAIREFKKVVTFSVGDYKVLRRSDGEAQKQLASFDSDPETIGFLGNAYALAGRRSEAREILRGLINMAQARYVEPHAIALVYTGLGDHDRAFEWLEKAYNHRSATLTYIKVLPLLDPIRSDPRYEELLARMGLQF